MYIQNWNIMWLIPKLFVSSLTLLYTTYRGVRNLKFLLITYSIKNTTDGPSLTWGTSSEINKGQKMNKGQLNTETSGLYIPWNNSPLEKIPWQSWESNQGPLIRKRHCHWAQRPRKWSIKDLQSMQLKN